MSTTTTTPAGPFRIDGQDVSLTSLTFREQRQLRRLVRDLSDDADVMPAEAPLMDFLPALVAVVRARTDDRSPDELLEEALELNFGDVIPDDQGERPTKRSSSRSTASRKTKADDGGTPPS